MKTVSAWIKYQLALLTMTRSRYLEKCLSKEMPVEILPRTSCQPVTTCRAVTAWTIWAVCVYQSFTDFSDENEMHEDLYHPPIPVARSSQARRLLKNHLGLCPKTSYPLVSLILALEGMMKTLSCSLLPQHLETTFLSPLAPFFQLELYCLFLVGKKK